MEELNDTLDTVSFSVPYFGLCDIIVQVEEPKVPFHRSLLLCNLITIPNV